MTLQEAREILITKTLPMTPEELACYKEALAIVNGSFTIIPGE